VRVLGLAAAALAVTALGATARAGDRAVAVTFDDLPAPPSGVVSTQVPALRENTRKLLKTLMAHKIPVVAFVNEGKLHVEGESDADVDRRSDLLKMWLDAGFELGNHTYSHESLNRTPIAEFEEDVVRGETVTHRLLAERGKTLRYFRHPFLQVGLDLEKRRAFEAFLKDRGYTIAPVTVDNDDYMFAALYADALKKNDRKTARKVGDAYLAYMAQVFPFVEDVSRVLLDREIPQVLLVHASALNADCFGQLATALEARGYRFVTLEQALADPAYRLPDNYVGAWGISWLHHWEITAGKKRSPSPDPPKWITKGYEALSRR